MMIYHVWSGARAKSRSELFFVAKFLPETAGTEESGGQSNTGLLVGRSMAVKKAVYKNVFLTMLCITIVNMLSLLYWSSGFNGSFKSL